MKKFALGGALIGACAGAVCGVASILVFHPYLGLPLSSILGGVIALLSVIVIKSCIRGYFDARVERVRAAVGQLGNINAQLAQANQAFNALAARIHRAGIANVLPLPTSFAGG